MVTVAIVVFFLALTGFIAMSLMDSAARAIQGYRSLVPAKARYERRPVIRLPKPRIAVSAKSPSRPLVGAAA